MRTEDSHSSAAGGAGAETPVPRRFGHYRVESSLGQGGMGEVLLAWDERLERHVAIKRIRSDRPLDDGRRRRFRREARAVARLNHPAVVQIFDVLDTEDGECIVMEYVEGHSLARRLDEGPLELREAPRLGAEIADGLRQAHAKGLVHRDLKPGNVIVTPAGRAKILDFGLARTAGDGGLPTATGGEPLTEPGALVGTVHAMSPEQASGRPVDHRSDLFALGGLLYEMLAGEAPFRGKNLLDTLWRVTNEEPRPLSEAAPQVPGELERLIRRLLAKDPADRPPNAGSVAAELERLLAPSSGAVPALSGRDVDPALVATLDPAPAEGPPQPAIRVLVSTGLVDGGKLPESLGDSRAAEVASRHDRMARDLLARFDGLEIDKRDGIFGLFERPADAVGFALAYHRALETLAGELEVELQAGIGIHLGEVFLRRNSPRDVARGAKRLEVDGLAKPIAARVAALAGGRQTLLTHGIFDLARHAAVSGPLADPGLRWLAHGSYVSDPAEEPLEVYEVGVEGFSPLCAPADSGQAKRVVGLGDELVLGWRPAGGQKIPRRPHWLLEERIGEGGFGEVWLARHKSGEERVFKFCFEAARLRALKREVTLFRLLKEALGHRDDIARVLDWNFDEAPYFLESEYTEGGSLVEWARDRGGIAEVPLAVRLDLVVQVAEALAAAHSVGILHKDVKPENVLIRSDRDGRPRAQLTDFGIGLLTDRRQLESGGVTVMGFTESLATGEATSSGTLRYMAPELMAGRPATVQADVYSLGVMLYQLVVGDFSRPVAAGWERDVADELLAEDIAGFVDGSPELRPASALEVAERLRTLEERRAGREAERRERLAGERSRRRRRMATAAGAVAAAMLVVVSIFALQTARARDRERQAREESERRRQQAEGLIDFMLGDLRAKLEPIGRLAILEDVGEKALEYFAAVPEADLSAEELRSRARALHQIGDVRFHQGDFPAAGQAFRQSLQLATALAEREPANTERRFALSQSHYWVGFLSLRQDDFEDALSHFLAYLEIAEELTAADPQNADWRLELAYAHSNVASARRSLGDSQGALRALQVSSEILTKLVEARPESSRLQAELATVISKIGRTLREQGHLQAALTRYRDNLDVRQRLADADPEDAARTRDVARGHHKLGDLLRMVGKPAGALEHYRELLAGIERLARQDPANTLWQRDLALAEERVGSVLRSLGELESSQAHLESGLGIARRLAGIELHHREWQLLVAAGRTSLARTAALQGRWAVARREVDEAVRILEPLGQEKGEDADPRLALGEALWLRGRIDAAAAQGRSAAESWRDARALIEPDARTSRDGLRLDLWIRVLVSLGDLETARPVLARLAASDYRDVELRAFLRDSGLEVAFAPGQDPASIPATTPTDEE
jgi:serine/threonine-protein kinase